MRKMTDEEIQRVIEAAKWATICTVGRGGRPYAIEATPFYSDEATCFMINPRGGTWKNLRNSGEVLLKYTLASPNLSDWIGVSCFGRGGFVLELEAIRAGWKILGEVMSADYSRAADKFAAQPDRSPLFAVQIAGRSGRTSARYGEALPLV